MFFDGYGYHGTSFEQTYRCYPASFIDKPQIENGDKIIMPPSALDRLASLHIDYPMLFELRNAATERVSHCGVLEFIAEEGMIYMPYWMMENLLLQEGDIVRVKNATLPKGTYVKLQPHTKDFLDISNPKAILETTLRNFSCLTTGDSIMVAYNNKKYYIDIIESKPSNAISIIETDCEVDFVKQGSRKKEKRPLLLHFHIGSQIPSTALLADGIGEAAQIYCELVRLGACMRVIDIGGGLGIDYDGSKSPDSDVSVGYTLEEYAAAVVQAVRFVCNRESVKHPVICSESGRAIVSHHSVLVFEAVSSSTHMPQMSSTDLKYFIERLPEDAHVDYRNLSAAAIRGEYETCLLYSDQLKQKCVEQFKEGSLDIEQLAVVDELCDLVSKAIGASDPVRTYHVNLSVFTSIPDFWGIGQLFPIVPIHRLDQNPGVKGILSDLTCDSDGKIDKFIGGEASLPLHELEGSGRGSYYLGMFLGGAYEEALGGVHNLFGGPSMVRVSQSDGPHSFVVTRAVPGPSCGDVLRVMQHEPEIMFEMLKHRAEEFVHNGSGHGLDHDAIANGLARSFHNMPYLVNSSCCITAANGNNGCYYCEVDKYGAVMDSVAAEDEQLTFCCA